ncbi:uncharacterized protein LOC100905775 [Galendromus occidentalis]|uniref:Uncharacterized protein LOC100905775 n=1 Tax=Galendromus occidentalis TaxID=34638 RepID=A0AAJ6QUI0_9ACAR|nr:uncharacterized protein LOC100905775 [Galendromus occidentalis]
MVSDSSSAQSSMHEMSVDLDPVNTYLVADTSVLIRSLPMVRALIESSLPYSVYIPYIVLTELDRGSTAAPVNRLLCRYMKQKQPRVIAQGVLGHKDVAQACGVVLKNDDLILGAALKLKEKGLKTVMLTNDNNLSVKSCANGLSCWSSVDSMCKLRDAIPEMDHFIIKDLRELCQNAQQLFTFCTDLLMCALKFQLGEESQLTSVNNGLVYRLVERVKERKIVRDSDLLDRTVALIRESRKRGRHLTHDSVQRFLRHVCAILETLKSKDAVARILNVCKGIFFALKSYPRATSKASLSSSIVEHKTNRRFESMSGAQRRQVIDIVTKADKARRKSDRIKKDISKRKKLPKVGSTGDAVDSDDQDDGMDVDDECAEGSSQLKATISAGPMFRGHDTTAEMSTRYSIGVEVIPKRPQQTFGPLVGDDIRCSPVYHMLETVWNFLHCVSGSWASRCGVEYCWKANPEAGLEVKLTTLAEFAESLGRIEEDYSRLLKLGNSVSSELLLTVAERFIKVLSEVCAKIFTATPREVVQFFQDERTSDILLHGRTQLGAFRDAIVRCRNKETQKTLARLANVEPNS